MISEYNSITNIFPKQWIQLLKTEESRATNVKTEFNTDIDTKTISETTDKFIYQYLMKKKFTKQHNIWSKSVGGDYDCVYIYRIINNIHNVQDNKVKQFRVKLLN